MERIRPAVPPGMRLVHYDPRDDLHDSGVEAVFDAVKRFCNEHSWKAPAKDGPPLMGWPGVDYDVGESDGGSDSEDYSDWDSELDGDFDEYMEDMHVAHGAHYYY